MMKSFAICVAVLVASACALQATPPPTLTGDFTANITLDEAGLKYHGYIVSDVIGHRTFRYVKELNETTYEFQSFEEATTYTYTIMNSGCTCQVTKGGIIRNLFGSLVTTTQSTKGCNSTYGTGTLFENNWLTRLPSSPQSNFCMNGETPVYVQAASHVVTFTNFKAGRPENFPLEPMNTWQDECNNACL